MRSRGLRVGLAMVVVALVLGVTVPAFADDAPPSTTEPTTTEPTTTPTTSPVPSDTLAPDTTTPDTTTPDTTAPAATAPAADVPVALANPAVTVTPSTGLVHLQSVSISGTGFTPNVSVGFAECKNNSSGDADDCDISHTGSASTDGSGAFSAAFVARRILHTPNGDVDCAAAPGTCNIGAAKITDYAEHGGAPLTFDPDAPLPPPATLLAGPTSGLVEGDSVALFGGGFVANSPVAIVQCSQPTTASCQSIASASADGNGGFITLVQVHRVVATPPFGATDCADAPGTCQVRAVSLTDYDREAHVLLDFDPNGPLPSGQVTVSPGTGLVNFQSVTLAGSGFPAGSFVQIVACTSDATSYEDCSNSSGGFAPISPGGTFSTPFTVRRILHTEGGDIDCASAPGACSLVSTAYGAPVPVVVATAISFDASVPPPPPPTIAVTPSADLVQGQSVTVTGANFAPNSNVVLSECRSDVAVPGYCLLIAGFANSDANGAFTTTFTVHRGVLDVATFPPAVVDCASGPQLCSITAFSDDGEDRASQAIDFDPSVALPAPDATVTPQFGLADRAVVGVHGGGFEPGERVRVSQCPAGAPLGGSCDASFGPLHFLVADANGEIQTSLRVHRELTTNDGGVIIFGTTGCAGSVGACVIRVQSVDDPLVHTDLPLGFDPTAVAPPPVLTANPAGPFTDGQQVEVHGSGYTPDAVLGLAECRAGVEPGGGTCDSGPDGLFSEFRADSDGTFTRTVTIHTEVQGTDGPIDCSASGSCVLFAANRTDYGVERAEVPIAFAAGAGVEVRAAAQTRALAFTGAGGATLPTAVIGFGLLLVGGALVLLARKRAVA